MKTKVLPAARAGAIFHERYRTVAFLLLVNIERLPGGKQDRPGSNTGTDTKWFVLHHPESAVLLLVGLAGNLVSPTSVIPVSLNGPAGHHLCCHDRLTDAGGFNGSNLVGFGLEQISKLQQAFRTLGWSKGGPWPGLVGSASCGDSRVDDMFISYRNGSNQVIVERRMDGVSILGV